MTPFRVSDALHSDPRVRTAGLAALGLWTAAGSWCQEHGTDGHVPGWFVSGWTGGTKAASGLVEAGLWSRETDGWVFVGWSQRSAAADARSRESARDRQQAWRDRQRGRGG